MLTNYLIYAFIGFISGGILFSYHIPKLIRGIDITKVSWDKNPGTANAVKHAGAVIGSACLICDISKGFIPVALAMHTLDFNSPMFAAVIFAPVLGHAWAPFYRIKGGKSIAVTFGVLSALIPSSFSVAVIAAAYIIFSVIFVVNPNEKRSVLTFFCLMMYSAIELIFFKNTSVSIACLLISLTVIYKNRIPAVKETTDENASPVGINVK